MAILDPSSDLKDENIWNKGANEGEEKNPDLIAYMNNLD